METTEYGFAESPFGELIVARTAAGICYLQFVNTTPHEAFDEFRRCWNSDVRATQNDEMACKVVKMMFEEHRKDIALDLRGTAFQLKVWAALQHVPFGQTVSYRQMACAIGQPAAVRAVASAIARNPVAVLVPCHRVIHSNGSTGQYHWGADLKKRLIRWEYNVTYGPDGHDADTLL